MKSKRKITTTTSSSQSSCKREERVDNMASMLVQDFAIRNSHSKTKNIRNRYTTKAAAAAKTGGGNNNPILTKVHQKRRERESAKSLLRDAPDILREVDECYLLQHSKRSYPTFRRNEVKVGPLLGVGGFGIVFEVSRFELDEPTEAELVGVEATTCIGAAGQSSAEATAAETQSEDDDDESALDHDTEDDNNSTPETTAVYSRQPSSVRFEDHILLDEKKKELPVEEEEASTEESSATASDPDQHDHHYQVESARQHMKEHARRNGDARYAIKRLHKDLGELQRARGMIDLAIEAKFLSGLWHPNIVKMRGMAEGPMMDQDFFIVMDRLYETLDKRIKTWSDTYNASKGNLFGMIGTKQSALEQLMIERMIVAYDLAAAFSYMHQNKLVYRDIKQQNFGFDIRGDVKIFDFGLSKAIRPELKARDSLGRPVHGYNLTPRTGSVPFMAPEVAECKPYDEKCDVFSFAILLWEILSLKVAFKGYSRREFLVRVVRGKERLPISRSWPPLTRMLIKEAWDHNPETRPNMKRTAALIRGDLNEMTTDKAVRDRTTHMRERSAHSTRGARLLQQKP